MYPHTGGPGKSFTDFYSNFQAMKKVGYLFLLLQNKDDVSPRGRQISVRCDKPYGIGKFWRPYYLNLPFWLDAPQSHRPIVEHQGTVAEWQNRRFCHAEIRIILGCCFGSRNSLLNSLMPHGLPYLLGRFPPDIVEFRAAHLDAFQNFYLFYGGSVERKNALHPYPIDNSSHGKRAAGFSAMLSRKHQTFKRLQAAFFFDFVFFDDSFRDFLPDAHIVSGFKSQFFPFISVYRRDGDGHRTALYHGRRRKVKCRNIEFRISNIEQHKIEKGETELQ